MKSKARLSIKGEPERQTTAVGSPDIPANVSMSTVLCSYLSVLMMITNGRLCYNATFWNIFQDNALNLLVLQFAQ